MKVEFQIRPAAELLRADGTPRRLFVIATVQPYGHAVGVPHLGHEPEVEILAAFDSETEEDLLSDADIATLRNCALDEYLRRQ